MKLALVKTCSAAALVLMLGSTAGAAQQSAAEICAAPDRRVSCSMLCCGRRTCPPSCEVDCVKACVDACAQPAAMSGFLGRVKQLQIRCGNRSVR
ncbi:MAG: hypothetical protein NW223_09295 [Hyphomicrobiaceae bacterium]|nr:hypothetical protein [Hyphomicrobiaceae bacterium]